MCLFSAVESSGERRPQYVEVRAGNPPRHIGRNQNMKRLKQHWRVVLRVLSLLLFCLGIFCGYWWFYKLAPARRTLDPEWYNTHSQREYWSEVQKGIHRRMWLHDDGFVVGTYGDKSWAEWIMAHVTPGTSMGCGGQLCHSATAMRHITNQNAGEDADAWLNWWEQNKSKSQQEWIADGFRHRGFDIDVPPKAEQTPRLLALLGNSETDELTEIPTEMKYNAFRCLRDSGFEPVVFVLSNRTMSGELERGLLEYAKWERCWPSLEGVGILPIGEKKDARGGMLLPQMLHPEFQVTANALVFGALILGVALLMWSFKKKKQDVESSPRPWPQPLADVSDGSGHP